uniref:Pleckstrin homology-like domain, family B, member 2b n=1 Tax=Myripristis murdjan TaxID=586833 RepID=A0A667ZK28_9TELE
MRSASELRDLMDTLQRKKIALENSLKANGDANPSYFSMTQVRHHSTYCLALIQGVLSWFLFLQAIPHWSKTVLTGDSSLLGISDGRRPHNQGSSPLLFSWNGGGSSNSVAGSDSFLLSPPPTSYSSSRTPSSGGAASMPSSPRLGRRSYGNQESSPSSRTRKYSAGSASGMLGGGHSRSLPRLCPSPSPRDNTRLVTLTTLPPRRSDVIGGYKLSKDHYNSISCKGVLSTGSSPPEPEKPASRIVSTEGERRGVGQELSSAIGFGLGERRSSFGKGGLEPGLGLGERRQSFGKAGVTPPGGFRERRGSISSLSGKEELTDYHQRQRDERLREQEVERLERQRLETILSLCSELGRAEKDTGTSPGSAVADLQKINRELEKLQVNDDDDAPESVFSDSSTINGTNGHITSAGSENGYGYDSDLQVRRRRCSGHRDNRAESPAISLRGSAPSPSPHAQRITEV